MEKLILRVFGAEPVDDQPPEKPAKEKVTKEELQTIFAQHLRPGSDAHRVQR